MRDAFTFLLPVVGDEQKRFKQTSVHVSSNGYYGYQAPVSGDRNNGSRTAETDMEVQFTNEDVSAAVANRKRNWDYAYETSAVPDTKKRREDERSAENVTNATLKEDSNRRKMDLLEELLIETHGVSWYHWCGGNE